VLLYWSFLYIIFFIGFRSGIPVRPFVFLPSRFVFVRFQKELALKT
jgi:hypothetical protein